MIDMVAAEFIPWFVRVISRIKNAVRYDRYGASEFIPWFSEFTSNPQTNISCYVQPQIWLITPDTLH